MLSIALTRLDIEQAIAPCPPTIGADAPFLAAVSLMASCHSSCVLVVAAAPTAGKLLGLLTAQDVVRVLAASAGVEGAIAAVITRPLITLKRSSLTDGLKLWTAFQQADVSHLPVVDDAGQVLGILTPSSLSQALTLAPGADPPESAPGAAVAGMDLATPPAIAESQCRSETTNRSLLQAVPDLLLRVRQDGTYIEALSRGNVKHVFMAEGPANSDHPGTLPPEVLARKRFYIQQAVTTGELQVFEQQVDVAGERCYEEVRVAPLDQNEALVMVRDITDRKTLELALRDSEAKGRAILATIPDLMFRVSAQGQYLEYISNRRTGDIVPLTVDVTGQYMAAVLPEEICRRQMYYLRRALDTQEFQVYEQQIQVGDRWQYEEVRVAPSGEQDVLFMIRDITERYEAALALRQRGDRERLIINLTQQIRQSLDLGQILQTTVTGVRQFLAADRVLIYRFNAEWGGDLIVESVEAPWMKVLNTTLRDPCFVEELVESYRQGRICQIDDLHNSQLSPCYVELLAQFQVQANLAVPITCDGELWGLLCVHQCRATRQWQSEEVELLTQLTAQLAIALQQATLYQHLQAELRERQRTETVLRNLVEGTAAVTGKDFFLALAQHIATAVGVNCVMVAELVGADGAAATLGAAAPGTGAPHYLQTLALWAHDQPQAPMRSPLTHTPGEATLLRGQFYCASGVQSQFPEDPDLVTWQADSYLGIVLPDAKGQAIGEICLLHTQPLADPQQAEALLQVFAARAGAELARQRATRDLECLNDELETKVMERTAELQSSETRFRRLAENLPGMVFRYVTRVDGTECFTYVSPRCQELFAIAAEAVLQTATRLWERIHPDDLEPFRQAAAAAVQDGLSLWNVEHRIITPTGGIKWIQSTAQPTQQPNGDILWDGFFLDISERKQLELSLQSSEAKLHYVLNSAIAAICNFRVNPNGTLVYHYYSPGFESILGYTPDQLITHKRLWLSRVHPADRVSVIQPLYGHIVSGQRAACYEYRAYHRDGRLRWIAATLTSCWDDAEHCWMVTTVDTDISDRKQAEIALQRKTSELQAIFNALPDLYFRLDAQGIICDYHGQRQDLLYAAPEQFMGQPISEVLPAALGQQLAAAIAVTRQSQSPVTLEYQLQVPAGLQDFEARLSPLEDGQVMMIVRDISDRQRLEVERQQSQQHLQSHKDFLQRVIDSVPSCIFVKDADLRIQIINQAMADLYGTTTAEAVGKCTMEFHRQVNAEQRRIFHLEDQSVLQSGETLVKHDRLVNDQGEVRWYQTTLKPFVNMPGQAPGLIGNSVDITDLRNTEMALQESEERLQLALEGSGDGLWDWNLLTGDLYMSPRWLTMLGYGVDELPAHISTWEGLLHPEDKPRVQKILQDQARDEVASYAFEYRLLMKSGEWQWIADYGKVVTRDAAGHPTRMVGIHQNISDRKQSEIALRQSEAHYRAIVEDQTELIARFLADGTLCFVNEAFCRYFQVQRHEILGQSYVPTVFVEDRDRVLQQIQSMSFEHPVVLVENRVVVRGEIRWTQWNNRMLFDDQGQLLEYQSVGRDITAAKQAEAALQRSQQQYRGLVNSIDAVVWEAEPETWQVTFISQQAFGLLGYALERWHAPHFWMNVVHPNDRDRILDLRAENLQPPQDFVIEYRMMAADGRVVWVRDTVRVRLENGQIQKLQGLLIDISDRKAAEAALFNSEQKFRGLFEMTGDAVMLLDETGLFDCNPQALRMFGYGTKAEFCGRHFAALSPPAQPQGESSERLAAEYIQIALQQGFHRFEWQHCHADGTEFPAEVLLCPMELQGQSILQGIVRDISARRRAEQSLHDRMEREQILGKITRHIRQSLDLDQILETTVTEVRQVFAAERALILRITPASTGCVVQESVRPGYPPTATQYFSEQPFPSACYASACAGQPWIVAHSPADTGADYLQGFMPELDVSSKIVAPLVQQDEHGHAVVWGLLMIHTCAEGRLWQPAEAEFLQQISNQVAIAIQQSELYHQLQDTNRHLARATRLKDEFLANMSHELRTPLNAILGLSEALQSPIFGPINDKQRQFITTIRASGSHLLALINDILDLAKMEAGKLELAIHPVPIQQLCQSSLIMVEQQALQKGVQLNFHLDPSLDRIAVDELRMRQVLVNLLNNAVKFTPTGGVVTLAVSLDYPEDVGPVAIPQFTTPDFTPPDFTPPEFIPPEFIPPEPAPHLYFSVIDTGIGMAPEDLGQLFQAFVQLDSGLARHYEGTGLGLVLVRRIVHLHGGQVLVASTPGQGSRFTVALPWRQSEHPHPWATLSEALDGPGPSDPDAPSHDQPHPLILLAEDQPDNAEMVSSYLESHGYRLVIATHGQEAIALAQNHRPNLVLMDIQMPGVDGLEAIRQLRADHQLAKVPIIALTALAMERDREQCLAAGANEYLPKPISLNQLLETIHQLLISQPSS